MKLNPALSKARGLIKIQKMGAPFRPVIKWKNASACKLRRLILKRLEFYFPLSYTFSVKKYCRIKETSSDEDIFVLLVLLVLFVLFVLLDISNMYTNILANECF
jgi:hypothetical protein